MGTSCCATSTTCTVGMGGACAAPPLWHAPINSVELTMASVLPCAMQAPERLMLRDVAKQARPVIILQRACQPMARAAARIHLRCRAHNQHAAEEMYGLRLRWDVDVDLDPAVLRPACGCGIVRDGSGRARAFDEHLPLVDAAARQDVADRLGTAERKVLVMRGSPRRIHKTQDAEAVLRILGEDVA